ncbi:ribonuclease P protein component [Mycoplasma iguanae]|uniref:Ribonuclease P protein component n=1 Tax=Mycoplasma iguanae TaxID=292461 RepID=A0ABY5RAD8_9MOLU|nr:ribonuclease P protein component [Mycoplasma iguanae]UVD81744.1 ribonuclease P protein component [Mycoplasma iguanae]
MSNFQRLRKNWEFQDIIKQKQQLVSKNIVLYFQKAEQFTIGISIPKKNSNAVMRNYYKRQVKSILRLIDTSNINYKVVFIARKTFLHLSFFEKKNEIFKIIERLRLEKK